MSIGKLVVVMSAFCILSAAALACGKDAPPAEAPVGPGRSHDGMGPHEHDHAHDHDHTGEHGHSHDGGAPGPHSHPHGHSHSH